MKKFTAIIVAAATTCGFLPLTACTPTKSDINSYDITAAYDADNSVLSARMTFDFVNDGDDEVSELKFNLWGNAYRDGAKYSPVSAESKSAAYYDGVNYGGMTVSGVEGCADWQTGGEDENILAVTLAESVFPDERAQITITYTLSLADINHRTGVTDGNTVNLGNFYPVLCHRDEGGYAEYPYYATGDPFVSDCADYTLTLTMPENYTAATSGREISKKVSGSTCTAVYELQRARDFAAVLSDCFETRTAQAKNCVVTVYSAGNDVPDGIAECAAESLDYFSEKFGKYAYPTYSVVLTPLSVSGMEYPALVMVDPKLENSDMVYTAVHETAHQWWYAMVGSDQVNAAWQDEGLAEYSTLCFFETHPAYGFTRAAMLGNATKAYRAYFSVYNQIFGKTDTSMSRSLDSFASDYEYANIAYNKGLIMFDVLRNAMGDDRFFAALADYFKQNAFSLAKEENLISALDAKYDTEGLIYGFLEGRTVI